jgi:hypothetical protein
MEKFECEIGDKVYDSFWFPELEGTVIGIGEAEIINVKFDSHSVYYTADGRYYLDARSTLSHKKYEVRFNLTKKIARYNWKWGDKAILIEDDRKIEVLIFRTADTHPDYPIRYFVEDIHGNVYKAKDCDLIPKVNN